MVKFAMPVEQVGQYEMLLFLTNLLSSFWVTGVIQALLPIFPTSEEKKSPALFTTFIVVLGFALVTVGVAVGLKSTLLAANGASGFPHYNLLLVYLALSPPTLLIEYFYLLKNKPKAVLRYGAITYALQLLLIVLPLLYSVDIQLSIYGLIAVTLVRFIWLIVIIIRHSAIRLDLNFMRQHIRATIPLSLRYLIGNSALYVDQLIVTAYFDQSMFAIYRFGARDIPLVTIMIYALSNSMLTDFRANVSDALRTLKKESLKLMHLLFPISILAVMLSKPLFPLLFSETYAQSAHIFMLYCLLITSRAILPQTVMVGLLHNGAALVISVVELLLNIALSLLLIKPFGIEGVVLATVLVNAIEKTLMVIYNRVQLKIPMSAYVAIRPYLLYNTLIVAAYIFFRFAL